MQNSAGSHNLCMAENVASGMYMWPEAALQYTPNEPGFPVRITFEGVNGQGWNELNALSYRPDSIGVEEMIAGLMNDPASKAVMMSGSYSHAAAHVMLDYWNGVMWLTMDFAQE